VDTIYHFAAKDGGSEYKATNGNTLFFENIAINTAVISAAIETGVRKLIYISSADVYPSENKLFKENDALSFTDKQLSGYASAKRLTEEMLQRFHNRKDYQTIIVRSGPVYGSGDNLNKGRLIPTIGNAVMNNIPLELKGDGNNIVSFLHIQDFVNVFVKLYDYNEGNLLLNLSSKQVISVKELVNKFQSYSKNKLTVKYLGNSISSARKLDCSLAEKLFGNFENFTLDMGIKEIIQNYK
jgi:nucleoside-diphosphate-sugar epimerase